MGCSTCICRRDARRSTLLFLFVVVGVFASGGCDSSGEEALPEKLVFPLVLGFLPGLLVWTLGPSFHQLFGIIDSIMGGGR